jgi:transposase
MAYSMDFRKRAIEYMEKGHTVAQLREAFGIFASTLNAWRKLMNETGSLKPRAIPGRPPMIDLENLKRAVEEKPDAYLRELAEPYNCSTTAVFNALRKHKITYKKNFHLFRKIRGKASGILN